MEGELGAGGGGFAADVDPAVVLGDGGYDGVED